MVHRVLIGAALGCLVLGVTGQAQQTAGKPAAAPTRAQSREVFLKACGRCHPPERVTATRRTKEQWEESINQMVTSRGATVTPEEYDVVLAYLVREHGVTAGGRSASPAGQRATPGASQPAAQPASPRGARTPAPPRPTGATAAGQPPAPPVRPRGGAGPDDKHLVDATAANRGRKTYAAACIQCHGTQARGGERGANIVRSLVLLEDRYGSTLGPFLRKGHPVQSGPPTTAYTDAQIGDLSHFLHERLNDTLRGSPVFTVQDVLTGDRKAGEAYFNGDGGCRQCHSPTGDLAGIGARLEPPALQQRFLFPRPPGRGPRGGAPAGKPTTVRVTSASGETVSGVLVHMDDFNVSLRDGSGNYRSWKRRPDLTVEKQDPYATHIALLDKYTDKNMHDIVAYLESLK